MRRIRHLVILLAILTGQAYAQLHVVKPVPPPKKPYNVSRLGIGVGRARSVLFLMRNIKQDNEAHGWDVSLAYNLSRVMKITSNYTWYRPIDIAPTWYGVEGRTFEVNVNWLFTFPDGRTRF